jgi:hypothetical protein
MSDFSFKVRQNNKGLIPYVMNYGAVDRPSSIPAQANAIVFINQGTSTAIINGFLRLDPSQSHSVDGNEGEWDNSNYVITFDTTIGTSNYLVIIRKVYQQLQ